MCECFTTSPLNKSDYTDLSFAESVVFYSTAFPPVIRLARHRHRHRARRRVGGVPASRRRRCESVVATRAGVRARHSDGPPSGRAGRTVSTLADIGFGNGCTIIIIILSASCFVVFFPYAFRFPIYFPLVFLFYHAHTRARWTSRVYDRAPDRVLGSSEPPVILSL